MAQKKTKKPSTRYGRAGRYEVIVRAEIPRYIEAADEEEAEQIALSRVREGLHRVGITNEDLSVARTPVRLGRAS